MKHVRHLELDSILDDLLGKRAAEQQHFLEDQRSGPNFFRGVIIALPISLSLWGLALYLIL